eukprot:IDg17429t1
MYSFDSFTASFTQQLLSSMVIAGLKVANGAIREINRKYPMLVYLQPSKKERKIVRVVMFSDAGFPHQGSLKNGSQERCLFGVSFCKEKGCIFNALGWLSRKR